MKPKHAFTVENTSGVLPEGSFIMWNGTFYSNQGLSHLKCSKCRDEVLVLVPGKYKFKNKGLCEHCAVNERPAICSKCVDSRPDVGWFLRWFHPAYLYGFEKIDLYCIRHTCLSSPDYVTGKKTKVLCTYQNIGGKCKYFEEKK